MRRLTKWAAAAFQPAWETSVDQAVERVVNVIRNRYAERLYVPELAADEYFSPFHFTRIFRRDTGVTPGQYLTGVRMFEAKRLLLNTSFSVAEVACRVGYPGVGTFTTRFTKLVGLPPGHYRRLPQGGMFSIADEVHQLPNPDLLPAAGRSLPPRANGCGGTIVGSVHVGFAGQVARLLVAVFDDPIPQGPPTAWALVPGVDTARWRLDGLPTGHRVVMAIAEVRPVEGVGRPAIVVCTGVPVRVDAGTIAAQVVLQLRRPHRTDPPIMVPLCNQLPMLPGLAA